MALKHTRNIDGLTPQQQTTKRANKQRRNHADEHKRRQLLKQWIATHGHWCPGATDLNHPPHPSNDLTVDHIHRQRHGGQPTPTNLRILCRPANSHRG